MPLASPPTVSRQRPKGSTARSAVGLGPDETLGMKSELVLMWEVIREVFYDTSPVSFHGT